MLNKEFNLEIDNFLVNMWKEAYKFRGDMNLADFREVFIGLVFYKIISEQLAFSQEDYLDKQKTITSYLLNHFIDKKILFSELIKSIYYSNEDVFLHQLENNLHFIANEFKYETDNIFQDVIVNIHKYYINRKIKNRNIISFMHCINYHIDKIIQIQDVDYPLIFDRFIEILSIMIGKKEGGICTPKKVINLITELIHMNRDSINLIYDPTLGTGNLVFSISDKIPANMIFGQEINVSNYNIAIMNKIIRGVNKSEIVLGDSLLSPAFDKQKFDVVVSHPPFNMKWENKKWLYEGRYRDVPPSSSADLAFVLHMLTQLEENGMMVVILPQGVLFRDNNSEKRIRQQIIEENYLDAVIGLPTNTFYETGISTCILVFKKNRDCNDFLFINASSEHDKYNKENVFSKKDMENIVNVYKTRSEINRYSAKVAVSAIRDRKYNLNIHKYIDTLGIEMLMKNYNFNKFKLNEIAQVSRYKEYGDENFILLRQHNPKIVSSKEYLRSNSNYIKILPKQDIVSAEYLEYFFDTPYFSNTVQQYY